MAERSVANQLQATRGRSDLLAALCSNRSRPSMQPSQSSRRIVVLTDGQAADWRLDDETGMETVSIDSAQSSPRCEQKMEIVRLDQLSSQPVAG